jgi:S1-C subfamily serine protease
VVREVRANSPAAVAGLRTGDLILSLDGQRVRDVRALAAAIESRGGTRVLRIVRDSELVDVGVRFR